MPSGEKGEPGDIAWSMEGDPLRPICCCCSNICGDHPSGDGRPERWNESSCGDTEIDAREANLPTGGLNETGEGPDGIAGLCDADGPPGRKGAENGKPGWGLLAADGVGKGNDGANGKG